MRIVLALLAVGSACADEPESRYGGEVLPDGYIRYTAPPVELQPGETVQYVHWVSPPIDRDLDVIDVRGSQGPGGHHAVLYASPDIEPVGRTRLWEATDQLTARFLGGAGGEGVSGGSGLPAGAVLRVPRGSGFYIQTHYLNASDQVLETTSSVEVLLADPSPDVTVLSMFVHSTLSIDVPPGPSEQVLDCEVQADTPMVMYVNHVHETGVSVITELVGLDGSRQVIKDDPVWQYEWTTEPNFTVEALARPLVLPTGASLVTRCRWDNAGTATLGFPDEMCAFLGFYIGGTDRACANGNWVEL